MTTPDGINVTFVEDKETKGSWRFKEVTAGPLDEPLLNTIYIRKSTLKQLGWKPGVRVTVTISL